MSTLTLADNAKTVASLYEAFGRGDISYILDHLADDCTWIGIGSGSLPAGGTYIGREAANFFMILNENESFDAFNVEEIHNIDNNGVVVFGNLETTSKKTGKKVSSDWVMRWKFNDEGKATYFHDFFDTAAAYIANQP
jgi:ketosteroid isomerase-like protein